jgi:hypothetical protein
MELQTTQPGVRPDYPPPPHVKPLVLFLVWFILSCLIEQYAPKPYQELLNSLVVDAWALYLCLWIRRLDPACKSAFWCDVYLVVEIGFASLTIPQHPSQGVQWLIILLGTASGLLGIATIYLIRDDLLKHYNQSEPIGLYLGPVMTFFFSFLYFQSKLYRIAQLKQRQAMGISQGPSGTLFR